MSVKMVGVAALMSQMQMAEADSVQAPCHEASQPMQAAGHDCCGLQGMCQTLCQVIALLPSFQGIVDLPAAFKIRLAFATAFQSADLSASFKPPLL